MMSKKISGRKVSKFFLTLGVLALILGIGYYIYEDYKENSRDSYFLMLEIKAKDMVITIEPRKYKAVVDGTKIDLNDKSIKEFADFLDAYITQLTEIDSDDKQTYLWTMKYQDSSLKEYYYADDSYPTDWDGFTKRVDTLLNNVYLSKEEELKEEEDHSIKSVSKIIFDDSCHAYSCTYSLKINNRTYPLVLNRSQSGDDIVQELVFNEKTIINENFKCGGITKLEVMEDTFVIYYHKGCGVDGNEIAIYNESGKRVLNLKGFNDYPGLYITNDEFSIKSNKITFNATRLIKGKITIDGVEIDPCLEESKFKYGIDDTFVVSASFELEYKNGVYENLSIVSSKSITDTNLLDGCQVVEEDMLDEGE